MIELILRLGLVWMHSIGPKVVRIPMKESMRNSITRKASRLSHPPKKGNIGYPSGYEDGLGHPVFVKVT